MKKHDLLLTPPCSSPFSFGDRVTYTNDYGVSFTGLGIIGFSQPERRGSFIHLDTESWWYSVRPEQLNLETQFNESGARKALITIDAQLQSDDKEELRSRMNVVAVESGISLDQLVKDTEIFAQRLLHGVRSVLK